jgi:hypothetical protein
LKVYNQALSAAEILNLYNYIGDISTSTLSLSGDLTITSGIVQSSSTSLILTGTTQTISTIATTTFASLTKTATASSTLIFGTSTNPLIITGTTTLTGGDTSSEYLKLRSTDPNTHWHFDPQGGRDFTYLDVQDSHNVSSTTIAIPDISKFTDSGRNEGWSFTQPTVTIGKQGRQIATTTADANNQDLGGAFTLTTADSGITLNSITLKQAGSVSTDSIHDVTLYHATTTNGLCSNTKPAGATLYGTATSTFSASSTVTFTEDYTLPATTTCIYLQYDLDTTLGTSTMGRSIDFQIINPQTDIEITGGTITTTRLVDIRGITILPPASDSNIFSLISFQMSDPNKNPTLYYLKDQIIWKQQGSGEPYHITNPNLRINEFKLTDMTYANNPGIYQVDLTISNMDPGEEDVFMNVTHSWHKMYFFKPWMVE